SAEIDAIFHLGASAKAVAPRTGGRGFGLVLVQQAVARLGGELDVESDGGAIFTVTLPLTGDNLGEGGDNGANDGSGHGGEGDDDRR
ncbi:MAG: ATP-binding protein, partial [Brevibacterium sp.]|nr:ATP-binding protein [Brevibacterium sp.]